MNVIILSVEQFEKIEKGIIELKEAINAKTKHQPLSETWLDSASVCQLLNISKRCLQNYRSEGVLPFTQISGKIYFKASDIQAQLEKNYINLNICR